MVLGDPPNVRLLGSMDEKAVPIRLHFVPCDGVRTRRHAKPESQRYLTEARKHVMRDIGFSRRRCKKKITVTITQHRQSSKTPEPSQQDESPETNDGVQDIIQEDDLWQPPVLEGVLLDSFVRLPVQLTQRMRYLLDHLLKSKCRTVGTLRAVSCEMLSFDTAWFYVSLGISGFCLSGQLAGTERKRARLEAFHHYETALSSVNNRLSDEQTRYSDGIILGILGIALHCLTPTSASSCPKWSWCWESVQYDQHTVPAPDQWVLHMKALQTIVRARGGTASLESNPPLRHFLYLVDMEGSSCRDMRPFFELPPYIPQTPRRSFAHSADVLACQSIWLKELPEEHAIMQVFLDLDSTIIWLVEQLHTRGDEFRGHPPVDALWLIPIVYQCVLLSGENSCRPDVAIDLENPQPEPDDSVFTEALRHAIILFLTPIRQIFCLGAGGSEIHVTKLIPALQQCLAHPAAPKLQSLIVWMLVVGSIEANSLSRDHAWFLTRIVELWRPGSLTGICAGIDVFVRRALLQMIWVDEVFSSSLNEMIEKLKIVSIMGDGL